MFWQFVTFLLYEVDEADFNYVTTWFDHISEYTFKSLQKHFMKEAFIISWKKKFLNT